MMKTSVIKNIVTFGQEPAELNGPNVPTPPLTRESKFVFAHRGNLAASDVPNFATPEERRAFLVKWTMDGLFKAPMKKSLEKWHTGEGKKEACQVLEIGTYDGPGAWLADLRREFPMAETYQTPQMRRENFEVGEEITNYPFGMRAFHFVSRRFAMEEIKDIYWPRSVTQLQLLVKFNGWGEFVEWDSWVYAAGEFTTKVFSIYYKHLELERRRRPFVARELQKIVKRADFYNVKGDFMSLPINWAGAIGDIMRDEISDLLFANQTVIGSELGFEKSETYGREVVGKVLQECSENHSYMNLHWAYGHIPKVASGNGFVIAVLMGSGGGGGY